METYLLFLIVLTRLKFKKRRKNEAKQHTTQITTLPTTQSFHNRN